MRGALTQNTLECLIWWMQERLIKESGTKGSQSQNNTQAIGFQIFIIQNLEIVTQKVEMWNKMLPREICGGKKSN